MTATAFETSLHLPALAGSKEQVARAETIRTALRLAVEVAIADGLLTQKGVDLLDKMFSERAEAAWWLDNRLSLDAAVTWSQIWTAHPDSAKALARTASYPPGTALRTVIGNVLLFLSRS